ncbi:hypothetical protein AN958_00697 [Leucoagaricus sp. SymC.cos]|nr:hypothetical protein AN958_00697 [Leucoagaricus sp. SymC.cos]
MISPKEDEEDEIALWEEDDDESYDHRGRPWDPKQEELDSSKTREDSIDLLVPSITRSLSISSARAPSISPPRITNRSVGNLNVPGRNTRKRSRRRNSRSRLTTSYSLQVSEPEPHPSALELVESKSKLYATKMECSTCGKRGAGFPLCACCGERWCSRECRVKGNGRHVCKPEEGFRSKVNSCKDE